jgi:hypothetical protein
MNFKYILIALLMLPPDVVYPQYFKYESYGFNTSEVEDKDGSHFEYILTDNDNYSNARITGPLDFDYNWNGIRYEIPERGAGVPQDNRKSVNIIALLDGGRGTVIWKGDRKEISGMIHSSTVGNLVLDQGGTLVKYYDLPVFDIEHHYLTVFIRNIFELLHDDSIAWMRQNSDPSNNGLLIMLPYFKKHELAIIRNCLFAKHRYDFQIPYWKELFTAYYSQYYKGIYTNSEAMEQFTDDEKWLLELVIKYEGSDNIENYIILENLIEESEETSSAYETDIFIDGKLTILVGKNKIAYLEYMFRGNREKIIEVIMPDGIIEIEQGGFAYNNIAALVLPSSVKIIRFAAFEKNPIENITIGLKNIITTVKWLAHINIIWN